MEKDLKNIDKIFKGLKVHEKALEAPTKDVEDAIESYRVSTENSSFYNKFLVAAGFRVRNLQEASLEELNRLERSLEKEERALNNIENGFLQKLSRRLYAAQGGLMSSIADLSQALGPEVYLLVKFAQAVLDLILMGDSYKAEIYGAFYKGLASSSRISMRYNDIILKMVNRIQHEGAVFNISAQETMDLVNIAQKEGATLNFTRKINKNVEMARDEIIEPAGTFATLFNKGASEIASLLGSGEYSYGRTLTESRRLYTSFIKEVEGSPMDMERYTGVLNSVDESLGIFGGISRDTVKFIANYLKSRGGSKIAYDSLDSVTDIASMDFAQAQLLLKRGIKTEAEVMKLRKAAKALDPKGSFDKDFKDTISTSINDLVPTPDLDPYRVELLKALLNKRADFLQPIYKNVMDFYEDMTFKREGLKALFEKDYIHILEFIRKDNTSPIGDTSTDEELDDYFELLRGASIFFGDLYTSPMDKIERSIQALKFELLAPAIMKSSGALNNFLKFLTQSWFVRYSTNRTEEDMSDFFKELTSFDYWKTKANDTFTHLEGIVDMIRYGGVVTEEYMEEQRKKKGLGKKPLGFLKYELEQKEKEYRKLLKDDGYNTSLKAIKESLSKSYFELRDFQGLQKSLDKSYNLLIIDKAYRDLEKAGKKEGLKPTWEAFKAKLLDYGSRSKEILEEYKKVMEKKNVVKVVAGE